VRCVDGECTTRRGYTQHKRRNTDHGDKESGNGKGVGAMANKRIAMDTRGELTTNASSQADGVFSLMIAPLE
jgi:hypothetical protein